MSAVRVRLSPQFKQLAHEAKLLSDSRNEGLRVDTLASRSDEGRGYRRNASGSWKQALIRRSPNEATCILFTECIGKVEQTQGTETS